MFGNGPKQCRDSKRLPKNQSIPGMRNGKKSSQEPLLVICEDFAGSATSQGHLFSLNGGQRKEGLGVLHCLHNVGNLSVPLKSADEQR